MRSPVLLAAVTVTLATSAAASPVTIMPGDPAVDGSFIKGYVNKWKLVGRGADGSVIEMGTWTDAARVGTINGREVLIRRQTWIHDRGSEGYYNVVDHKTLEPVISQYVNAGGLYRRFEFSADGKSVQYQFSPNPAGGGPGKQPGFSDPMGEGKISLQQPYLDFNTGMFGLLIAGFPLKEGYSARFPVFRSYDPKAEPAWIDFLVKGKEQVPAGPGKTVEAWLVVVNSPDTGEVITLDLIKTAPYVIRLRQPWEGRDWTFEMVDLPQPSQKPAS